MAGLTFITRQLLDDCAINLEEVVKHELCGDRRPSRWQPPVQPDVIPFRDAEEAVHELLKHGCVTQDRDGDAQCHYCGQYLDYEPHSENCAYLKAEHFVALGGLETK